MNPPRPINRTPAWANLRRHAAAGRRISLRELFDRDPKRFDQLSFRCGDLLLDLSRQRLTRQTVALLLRLAETADLKGWRQRLFAGARINTSENRPVLHPALRLPAGRSLKVAGTDVAAQARRERDRMLAMAETIRTGSFRRVVAIGIGGSDLGPRMVVDALAADRLPGPEIRFVSNVDGADLAQALADADAATTLFIVASKTFTTQETMTNAASAREWLRSRLRNKAAWQRHFIAITAAPEQAAAFGIARERCLIFWDWVGGRYSLWSAIGLPIAIAVGARNYRRLLAGAHEMDEHFRTAPLDRNLPVLMALAGIWNINFLGMTDLAVLPYDQGLARLPAYLQQADMESNGKSVDRWGRPVRYATGPVVFGEPGTNGQHAFYQLLHQGPKIIPVELIVPLQSRYPIGDHHAILLANAFAQAEALMVGRSRAAIEKDMAGRQNAAEARTLAAQKAFSGNRPSTMLLLPRIDPFNLGMLIALYEHKIFVQGILWGINSFDQWGVELGKSLAKPILQELTDPKRPLHHDAATSGVIGIARRKRRPQA